MNATRLQQIITDAVTKKEIAGGALLVLQNGKEQAYCRSGMADIANGIEFKRDTIVRLYSATKPITGAAAMLLIERGLLDPGQEVSAYLKGFENQRVFQNGDLVPVKRSMLIGDLLNMTAGLPYGGAENNVSSMYVKQVFEDIDANLQSPNSLTTLEIANRLGQGPLSFHPGEHWQYGTAADIMGALIEVITGMRFGEFLKKEFFQPLEMDDTDFFVPIEKQNRLSKTYEKTHYEITEVQTNHLGIRQAGQTPPSFESGGAGLFSTLNDYSKFAQMLLNQGSYNRKQILSPQIVRFFTKSELYPEQEKDLVNRFPALNGYTYGNFLRILMNPAKTLTLGTPGEYGWDGWLGFYFCNCPQNRLTMLLSMQLTNAGTLPVTRKLKNAIWCQV